MLRTLPLVWLALASLVPVVGFSPKQAEAQYTAVPGNASAPVPTVSSGQILNVDVEPDNSYCCQMIAATLSERLYFSSSSLTLSHMSGSITIPGYSKGSDAPRLTNGSARMCFTVPAGYTAPSVAMPIGVGVGPVSNVTFECTETTLYGGFNTSVTDFNFLEITNTMPDSIALRVVNGRIKVIDVVPTPDVVIVDNEAFEVGPDTRYDMNIHERTGPNRFGVIKITHNNAPGSIKAVLSQYNITSTSPFQFAPVAQEVLRTRAELAGGR